jgi:acetyl-CoA carboxylase carboxyltransferase component
VNDEQARSSLEMFKGMVEKTADVYYTSARCLDDGIIDPRHTRIVLGISLEIVHQGNEVKGENTFGISRL